MIGLLLFAGLAIWLVLAVWISSRIVKWMGTTNYPNTRGVTVFLLVLIAPVADELIGRWQFHQLCEREAVVTLSPGWEKVTAARDNDDPITELDGYVIPIRVQRVELVDLNTNLPFLTFKAFHTKGGLLMRNGLGLNGTTSCWPPNWTQVMNQVDSDKLIKQGKSK